MSYLARGLAPNIGGVIESNSDTPPGAKAPRLLLPLLCTRYAEKWSVAPTRCAS